MALPRSLPIDDLIKTSEETVRIAWNAYEAHLAQNPRQPLWETTRRELHLRATKLDERLRVLKNIRTRPAD